MIAIYAVHATTLDHPLFLGYATGKIEDIKAYYDDRKQYGLEVTAVKPLHIPEGYAHKREGLLGRKAQLEKELKDIERQIKQT